MISRETQQFIKILELSQPLTKVQFPYMSDEVIQELGELGFKVESKLNMVSTYLTNEGVEKPLKEPYQEISYLVSRNLS